MKLTKRGKILVGAILLTLSFGIGNIVLGEINKNEVVDKPIVVNYAINEITNIVEEKIYEQGEIFVRNFDYENSDMKEYAIEVTYDIILNTMNSINNENNITLDDLVRNGSINDLTNLTMRILNDNYEIE